MIGAIKRRWKSKKAKVLHKGSELSTSSDSCPTSRGFVVDGCEDFEKMIKPPSPRQVHPVLEKGDMKCGHHNHQTTHQLLQHPVRKKSSTLPSSDDGCPFIRVNSGRIELVSNKDKESSSGSSWKSGGGGGRGDGLNEAYGSRSTKVSTRQSFRDGRRIESRNDSRHSWCGSALRSELEVAHKKKSGGGAGVGLREQVGRVVITSSSVSGREPSQLSPTASVSAATAGERRAGGTGTAAATPPQQQQPLTSRPPPLPLPVPVASSNSSSNNNNNTNNTNISNSDPNSANINPSSQNQIPSKSNTSTSASSSSTLAAANTNLVLSHPQLLSMAVRETVDFPSTATGNVRVLLSPLKERLTAIEEIAGNLQSWQVTEKIEYERCVSDLASQVSRAVALQQLMKSEVEKLQQRVVELESHNKAMATMIIPTLMKLHETVGKENPSQSVGIQAEVESPSSSPNTNPKLTTEEKLEKMERKSPKHRKIDCRIPRMSMSSSGRLSRAGSGSNSNQNPYNQSQHQEQQPEHHQNQMDEISNECKTDCQEASPGSLSPSSKSESSMTTSASKHHPSSRAAPSSTTPHSTSSANNAKGSSSHGKTSSTYSGIPRMSSPRPPPFHGNPNQTSKEITKSRRNDSPRNPHDLHALSAPNNTSPSSSILHNSNISNSCSSTSSGSGGGSGNPSGSNSSLGTGTNNSHNSSCSRLPVRKNLGGSGGGHHHKGSSDAKNNTSSPSSKSANQGKHISNVKKVSGAHTLSKTPSPSSFTSSSSSSNSNPSPTTRSGSPKSTGSPSPITIMTASGTETVSKTAVIVGGGSIVGGGGKPSLKTGTKDEGYSTMSSEALAEQEKTSAGDVVVVGGGTGSAGVTVGIIGGVNSGGREEMMVGRGKESCISKTMHKSNTFNTFREMGLGLNVSDNYGLRSGNGIPSKSKLIMTEGRNFTSLPIGRVVGGVGMVSGNINVHGNHHRHRHPGTQPSLSSPSSSTSRGTSIGTAVSSGTAPYSSSSTSPAALKTMCGNVRIIRGLPYEMEEGEMSTEDPTSTSTILWEDSDDSDVLFLPLEMSSGSSSRSTLIPSCQESNGSPVLSSGPCPTNGLSNGGGPNSNPIFPLKQLQLHLLSQTSQINRKIENKKEREHEMERIMASMVGNGGLGLTSPGHGPPALGFLQSNGEDRALIEKWMRLEDGRNEVQWDDEWAWDWDGVQQPPQLHLQPNNNQQSAQGEAEEQKCLRSIRERETDGNEEGDDESTTTDGLEDNEDDDDFWFPSNLANNSKHLGRKRVEGRRQVAVRENNSLGPTLSIEETPETKDSLPPTYTSSLEMGTLSSTAALSPSTSTSPSHQIDSSTWTKSKGGKIKSKLVQLDDESQSFQSSPFTAAPTPASASSSYAMSSNSLEKSTRNNNSGGGVDTGIPSSHSLKSQLKKNPVNNSHSSTYEKKEKKVVDGGVGGGASGCFSGSSSFQFHIHSDSDYENLDSEVKMVGVGTGVGLYGGVEDGLLINETRSGSTVSVLMSNCGTSMDPGAGAGGLVGEDIGPPPVIEFTPEFYHLVNYGSNLSFSDNESNSNSPYHHSHSHQQAHLQQQQQHNSNSSGSRSSNQIHPNQQQCNSHNNSSATPTTTPSIKDRDKSLNNNSSSNLNSNSQQNGESCGVSRGGGSNPMAASKKSKPSTASCSSASSSLSTACDALRMDDKVSQTDFASSHENLSTSFELFTECRNCLEIIKKLVAEDNNLGCGGSCEESPSTVTTLDRKYHHAQMEERTDAGCPTTWLSVPKGLPTTEVDRILEILSSSESEDILSPGK